MDMNRPDLTTIGTAIAAAAVSAALTAGVVLTLTADPPPSGPTPPSCVRALDLASEGFDAASDATDAAMRGDRHAADEANDRLESIAPDAGEANRACRRGE